MKKFLITACCFFGMVGSYAQGVLSLERCRELALQNNRQLKVSSLAIEVAEEAHNVAKTKYLPRVDGLAGYTHFSKEVSLLNSEQKSSLSNLGNNSIGQLSNNLSANISEWAQQGIISPEVAQRLGNMLSGAGTPATEALNNIGQAIRDAFRTNNKNMYTGAIMVTQPVYMGGAIKTANDLAAKGEELARNNLENKRQTVLYAVDNAYWMAVSLKNKERLAEQYKSLVEQLQQDVQKMIQEGVATRSDGLKVDVAVNTADLELTRARDGVALVKMALCELCGLPLNGELRLADEGVSQAMPDRMSMGAYATDTTFSARPEVRMLTNLVDMTELNTRLIQSLYKPHIALTGGYLVSNPNVFNGFEQKFAGVWNIGIVMQVPIWNWGESKYRTRSAKTMTTIANLELSDLRSKINLQVEQSRFQLKEATLKLEKSRKNLAAAEENLRCANLGFKEGVMTVTDVQRAQTAWLMAQTQHLDAEIDVRLAQTSLHKAMGTIGK